VENEGQARMSLGAAANVAGPPSAPLRSAPRKTVGPGAGQSAGRTRTACFSVRIVTPLRRQYSDAESRRAEIIDQPAVEQCHVFHQAVVIARSVASANERSKGCASGLRRACSMLATTRSVNAARRYVAIELASAVERAQRPCKLYVVGTMQTLVAVATGGGGTPSASTPSSAWATFESHRPALRTQQFRCSGNQSGPRKPTRTMKAAGAAGWGSNM